ncbi:UDP-3-O-acylglucosamine N-acyltransferase [Marinobacter zhanjiangensis]|uniref:UDP-3-O-acylglucosamine N-acyltransferase n=2 Tax=Marinobacter zhanjiangensis TaxID=578215 RepID=A0ABQ3B4K6_9GAMM|nr:UDP-3-O-acylglucosamine N-acyltransferase [Marinobacter zhanjiangensis]
MTLAEIAAALGAELKGDPDLEITGLATLEAAGPDQLSFIANAAYSRFLATTRAGAVLASPALADQVQTNVLLLDDPYLGYARISHRFETAPAPRPGVHDTAVIDPGVRVPDSASIGPHVVIEAGVSLGERVVVGAHGFIGANCVLGDDCLLRPRVTLAHGVSMGRRCHILSGAVIGSDGFGFAVHEGEWNRIAQIGNVILGDDVEVGANTAIDRGALDDTRLGNGVKIDNLVQVAHNVQIGDHTAMAGKVGVAGSTRIGRHCMFGGASVISGHLTITDGVQVTGMTMVTGDIREPGVYSSGTGHMTNREWRKNAARFRQLDAMARRLKELEKKTEG